MKYTINGFLKHSEIDNFENGCTGENAQTTWIETRLSADNLPDLVALAENFTGHEWTKDDIEPGRMDFSGMENANGMPPSDREYDEWKAGKIDLYLCDYSAFVESCEVADLSSLFA